MMTKNMTSVTWIGSLGFLSMCLWLFVGSAQSGVADDRFHQDSIPIAVTQLPPVEETIPVTLRCETSDYPQPKVGKALRCIVTNNTMRPITAVSLAYSIIYEAGLKEVSDDGFMTLDTLIHPDFHDSNQRKFIQPSAECVIQRGGPIDQPNMSPKRISVKVDYVEFEDGSGLGSNTSGSRLIGQLREGAVRFKEWLKVKYLEHGRSMNVVVQLLSDTESPATELKLNDNMIILGAEAYRRNAREALNSRGASEIEKHLAEKGRSKPKDR